MSVIITYQIHDAKKGVWSKPKRHTFAAIHDAATAKAAFADWITSFENYKILNVKEVSPYDKDWILTNGIPIVQSYNGNITLRNLHYRLVAKGMTNDIPHYKKIVAAMTDARWNGDLPFDAFKDYERETHGSTPYEVTELDDKVKQAKSAIQGWADYYSKNRWENQPNYVEVWVEKKGMRGVFEDLCSRARVALNPCKGYPSVTYLWDAKQRFDEAIDAGKEVIILYFGDYDCTGEDIPRSIQDSLEKMGTIVEVRRVALMEHQVKAWNLPPAPTKESDTRGNNWDGIGQVEFEAIEPRTVEKLFADSMAEVFDDDLHLELRETETDERAEYRQQLREYLMNMFDEDADDE